MFCGRVSFDTAENIPAHSTTSPCLQAPYLRKGRARLTQDTQYRHAAS